MRIDVIFRATSGTAKNRAGSQQRHGRSGYIYRGGVSARHIYRGGVSARLGKVRTDWIGDTVFYVQASAQGDVDAAGRFS
jgi:hypothetical protein